MADDKQTDSTSQTSEGNKGSNYSLLARQHFGADFHGEVREPQAPDDYTGDDQDAGGSSDDETPAGQEHLPGSDDDAANEDDGDDTQDGDERPGTETDDDAGGEEYPLEDVAQLLGVDADRVDVDADGRLVLVGKVDGEAHPFSLKDLLDNAQMYEAGGKRLEQAKEKSQSQIQQIEQQRQQVQDQYAAAAKLVTELENAFKSQYDSINWKQLREDDPAEYAAKQAEMRDHQNKIDRYKQEAVEQFRSVIESATQVSPEQQQEVIQREQEALMEKVPEWKDQKVARHEQAELVKHLKGRGYSEQEIVAASVHNPDHRFIQLARESMLYNQGKAKVKAATKRVKKVPRVVKPGTTSATQQASTNERVKKARARLNKTGSVEDAFAYMKAKAKTGG